MDKVEKWIASGKKNCKEGNHWHILHYPDYQLCPLCGHRESYSAIVPEFNGYLVREMKIKPK
ncbi:MAG: hypothetical protein JRF53_16510 [Deltaproteobacteria bacterium]|nr:hypothetical protein [Deltaproteobacteria bacterium]